MPLQWTNTRSPRRLDELTPEDCAQLRVVGRLYFGEERPLSALLSREGGASFDEDGLSELQVSAILEDGVHAYDAWSYQADSGTFFRAGTTEVVGEIIQCGFEPHLETDAGARFAAAYEREAT